MNEQTPGIIGARRNAILEVVYFSGKLGKERIRIIVKGQVEIPGNLHGILYEKHDVGVAPYCCP